jgi:CxxC-x17-CxxC domain-containing protein
MAHRAGAPNTGATDARLTAARILRRDSSGSGSGTDSCDPHRRTDTVYEDRTLACRDCGEGFIFSGGEQRFFAEKGLQNVPQRCPTCRANAKRVRMGGPREYHAAVCNACGNQAMVPFAPRTDRPVYCSSCFDKVRAGQIDPAAAPAIS